MMNFPQQNLRFHTAVFALSDRAVICHDIEYSEDIPTTVNLHQVEL